MSAVPLPEPIAPLPEIKEAFEAICARMDAVIADKTACDRKPHYEVVQFEMLLNRHGGPKAALGDEFPLWQDAMGRFRHAQGANFRERINTSTHYDTPMQTYAACQNLFNWLHRHNDQASQKDVDVLILAWMFAIGTHQIFGERYVEQVEAWAARNAAVPRPE